MQPDPNSVKRSSFGRKVKYWFSRHEWTLIGLLAAFVYLLACIGYSQILDFNSGEFSRWDIFYASIQLFIFEAPDATAGWPFYMQFARVTAPLILIYTAIKAIWGQVRSLSSLYLLQYKYRQFVVICGLGETGVRLAREYLESTEYKVVVIEQDDNNPFFSELQDLGAISVIGNAMDFVVLARVKAQFAKEVFIFTGNEEVNIAIAKNIERLTRLITDKQIIRCRKNSNTHKKVTNSNNHGLNCFIQVDSPDIYEVFAGHSFFELVSEKFTVRLINKIEHVARNLFKQCAPDLYYLPRSTKDDPTHIVFLGFEALDRELILQTALTAHYPDKRIPMATVFCPPSSQSLVQRFYHRYPNLGAVIDLHFVYDDPMTISHEQWIQLQERAPFTLCYSAMRKDVEAILSARRLKRLNQIYYPTGLKFVVCLNQQSYLAEIIDDDFKEILTDKSQLIALGDIEYFESLDKTITIDVIVNESLDLIARALHESYLALVKQSLKKTTSPFEPTEHPSLVPWHNLPTHKRRANQRAADHLDVKLRIVNLATQPIEQSISQKLTSKNANTKEKVISACKSDNILNYINPLQLDLLAELEHRRWMADKLLSGYCFGESLDELRMMHPDLIDWSQLSETDKEKDRNNIRSIPSLLAIQEQRLVINQEPNQHHVANKNAELEVEPYA